MITSQNNKMDINSEKVQVFGQLDSLPKHICPEKISVIPKDYKNLPVMQEAEFRAMLLKSINENSLRYLHPKLCGEGGVVEAKHISADEKRRIQNFHKNSEFDMTQDEHSFTKEEVFLPCLSVCSISS